MLLEDGESVAACFELTPIGTEGREAHWLWQVRDALENALQDSFDELDEQPWVVQLYAQDEADWASYLRTLQDYIQPRAQGSAFTDFYLRFLTHHLRAIAKPGGLFEDTAGPLVLLRRADSDLATLGQLGLALQLTMIGVVTIQPFLAAALPVLSRSVAREDSRVAFYGAWVALASLVTFGGIAGLGFLVGPTLVVWVFGQDFALAGELLGPCLLIGGLIIAPTGYGQLLVVKGQRWPAALAGGIGGVILLVALPPAVAHWGAFGAVFAAIAAWLIRAVVLIACAPARSRGARRLDPS
jgi:hypothetical protein